MEDIVDVAAGAATPNVRPVAGAADIVGAVVAAPKLNVLFKFAAGADAPNDRPVPAAGVPKPNPDMIPALAN